MDAFAAATQESKEKGKAPEGKQRLEKFRPGNIAQKP